MSWVCCGDHHGEVERELQCLCTTALHLQHKLQQCATTMRCTAALLGSYVTGLTGLIALPLPLASLSNLRFSTFLNLEFLRSGSLLWASCYDTLLPPAHP